ncbi:hypothetical protein LCGC14_0417800 [marine sediment metagenome]|uniref:Uncharacterized protein n=1 Tax=marine sediment metagenome TaxID=412755 RepID=A0A0F9SXP2_9ZZZZ
MTDQVHKRIIRLHDSIPAVTASDGRIRAELRRIALLLKPVEDDSWKDRTGIPLK